MARVITFFKYKQSTVHIILPQETRLDKKDTLYDSNYNILITGREDSYGGVAVIVYKNFKFKSYKNTEH